MSKLTLHRCAAASGSGYARPLVSRNGAFLDESARLEVIAIESRDRIDGLVFFANDQNGALVPRKVINSFALRFYEATP